MFDSLNHCQDHQTTCWEGLPLPGRLLLSVRPPIQQFPALVSHTQAARCQCADMFDRADGHVTSPAALFEDGRSDLAPSEQLSGL